MSFYKIAHKRNIEDCGDGSSVFAESPLASELFYLPVAFQFLRDFLSKATLYELDG